MDRNGGGWMRALARARGWPGRSGATGEHDVIVSVGSATSKPVAWTQEGDGDPASPGVSLLNLSTTRSPTLHLRAWIA